MSELMNEIYYMLTERIGQETAQDKEVKILSLRKCVITDEIIIRLGDKGNDLIDELTNVNAELENIHGMALFRAALHLGTEAAASRRGTVDPAHKQ